MLYKYTVNTKQKHRKISSYISENNLGPCSISWYIFGNLQRLSTTVLLAVIIPGRKIKLLLPVSLYWFVFNLIWKLLIPLKYYLIYYLFGKRSKDWQMLLNNKFVDISVDTLFAHIPQIFLLAQLYHFLEQSGQWITQER